MAGYIGKLEYSRKKLQANGPMAERKKILVIEFEKFEHCGLIGNKCHIVRYAKCSYFLFATTPFLSPMAVQWAYRIVFTKTTCIWLCL